MNLEIRDIEIDCVIGEREDERLRVQRIHADMFLEVSDKVRETDDMAHAADYVEIASSLRKAIQEAQPKTIERAAFLAASSALNFSAVSSVTARIRKAHSVPGIGEAIAECRLSNKICGIFHR